MYRQLRGSAAPGWVGGGLQDCIPPDMRQECHSMLARLWSRQNGVCQPCGVLHHKLWSPVRLKMLHVSRTT